jgi:hypothetical protein
VGVSWEYKLVEVGEGGLLADGVDAEAEAELNDFGAEGWELAATLSRTRTGFGGGQTVQTDVLVFKRPRTD